MKIIDTIFNELAISEFIIGLLERLLRSNYGYVRYLRNVFNLSISDSLDIVVVLDFYKGYIPHIFKALNYRLANNREILTFFRGADNRSFLFPSGVNVLFVDLSEFQRFKNRWNIISGICESCFFPLLRDNLLEVRHLAKGYSIPDILSVLLVVRENAYYSSDKEIIELWGGSR